jgi:hypothetical protein
MPGMREHWTRAGRGGRGQGLKEMTQTLLSILLEPNDLLADAQRIRRMV